MENKLEERMPSLIHFPKGATYLGRTVEQPFTISNGLVAVFLAEKGRIDMQPKNMGEQAGIETAVDVARVLESLQRLECRQSELEVSLTTSGASDASPAISNNESEPANGTPAHTAPHILSFRDRKAAFVKAANEKLGAQKIAGGTPVALPSMEKTTAPVMEPSLLAKVEKFPNGSLFTGNGDFGVVQDINTETGIITYFLPKMDDESGDLIRDGKGQLVIELVEEKFEEFIGSFDDLEVLQFAEPIDIRNENEVRSALEAHIDRQTEATE